MFGIENGLVFKYSEVIGIVAWGTADDTPFIQLKRKLTSDEMRDFLAWCDGEFNIAFA